MKTICAGLVLYSVLALNAWSQGRITFVNNLPTLRAPIYGPELDFINYGGDWADAKTGNSPTGIPAGTQTYGGTLLESFSVSFWAAPGVVTDGHLLLPASSTAVLGTGSLAGYFPATSVLFTGLPATGLATLQVRVTDPSGTWMFAGDQFGHYAAVSALFTVNLSSLGSTATGLRSFSVGWIDSTTLAPYVPEPGMASLLVLGAVALMFRGRSRKLL